MTSNRSEIQWLMTNYVIFFFINYPSNANSFEIPNNGNEKHMANANTWQMHDVEG